MYDKISLDRVYGFLILVDYKGLHNDMFKFFTQDLGQTPFSLIFLGSIYLCQKHQTHTLRL